MEKNQKSEKNDPPKKEREPEFGGYEKKIEPTRYGDWDANGRVSDF